MIGRIGLLVVLVWLSATPWRADAHTRSVSYSSWQRSDSGATVRVRISLLELSRVGLATAGVADAGAAAYLNSRLELRAGSASCKRVGAARRLESAPGWSHFEWRLECPIAGPLEISSRILLETAPGHLHFARVDVGGERPRERVLTLAESRWLLASDATVAAESGRAEGTSLSGYVALGIEHILSGWDHLAFVLALLLLAGGVGEVARLVTGFTLAHSLTLGLAVMGVLAPEPAAVEALIGFSIALVAAENGWLMAGGGRGVPLVVVSGLLLLAGLAAWGVGAVSPATLVGLALFSGCHFMLLERASRPQRLRIAVAFAFGLVHGFGFAGVLGEMSLPTSRLVPALFGFNIGVELGQLAVIALVWPLLRVLEVRATSKIHHLVYDLSTAAICGLGVFWFFTRSFQ